jgi:carboxypeptidase Taq
LNWGEGLFGYFPSYALGHLISAQIAEALEHEIGSIEDLVRAGKESALQAWLARAVWPLGRSVNGEELVEKVTGRPLSAEPFLAYLRSKVDALSSGT